jgi:hypothetical protein
MLGSLIFPVKGKLMRNEKNSHASEIPVLSALHVKGKRLVLWISHPQELSALSASDNRRPGGVVIFIDRR